MNDAGTLTIEALDPTDQMSVLAAATLVNQHFGSERTARLRARVLAPHTCFVSRAPSGTINGVLSARVAGDGDRALVDRLVASSGHTSGIIDDLAVDPEWRGNGIGTALMDAGLRHLRTAGCTIVLTEVWRSGIYESFGLATRAGFETVVHVIGYWSAASNDAISGWDCKTCGRPCKCPATLMRRALR
ncbi:MAG: GNAT family N-acetyltransferase [Acidimicrobiia bacterium]